MTMATKAQHAHTNMPSNDQVPYWKSHATVSTIFSFSRVFTNKKVFNFVLLLIMTNRNDMREDEQGNDNADMKTPQPNLMHERQRKSTAVQGTDGYAMELVYKLYYVNVNTIYITSVEQRYLSGFLAERKKGIVEACIAVPELISSPLFRFDALLVNGLAVLKKMRVRFK